jgi:ferrous iron transport protein B
MRLGVKPDRWDYLVALAGNPNTGKSTVFNALTGLRQHTGNWPGKTVTRAEGMLTFGGRRLKLVDLPGSYSLHAGSADEEVARDFLLFGRPDVTVVVVDATRLERNLKLVLQVLAITDRVVVCLNLMDEARRHGIALDPARLAAELGVPVVPTAARQGAGIRELVEAIHRVASGAAPSHPFQTGRYPPAVERVVGELGSAATLRWRSGESFHDAATERTYAEAERIAGQATRTGPERAQGTFDRRLDRLLTSRWFGFPLMLVILAVVFWITISGANIPSGLLSDLLLGAFHPTLKSFSAVAGLPWWLDGLLVDGLYLATAWVVSVMLPPMAIFFPLFTLLEDFGYLPRVAFNLDRLFQKAGAHGKQALTMCMGFGCNAAGVVATRVIDSPRERLVAILTNNFSLCNGRWPTQILIATIFLGSLAPAALAGAVAAAAVVGVAVLGIAAMFFASWLLSRTALRGEATTFSLELPPYRPPRVLQTLYTSLIDRTLIVLWRAVVFAAPAGAVIWLTANIRVGGASLAEHAVRWLDPVGILIGLNGVILLAYLVAIPANEIVIPTVLMLTVLVTGATGVGEGAGVMFQPDSVSELADLLRAGGWTLLTGVNLMLFTLLHNPCSTTIYTIYQETRRARWTTLAALLPLGMGFVACFLVAQVWRLLS